MKGKIMLLLALLGVSSCSFNRSFYQATKIPAGAKKATFTEPDGNKIYMNVGLNFQPTFTDTLNNELPRDYTIESVLFKNDRDNKLNGWFIKPKRQDKVNVTLLFLHGNGGNIPMHYPAATQLAMQGFQVFIIDYAGYGFSEGKPTRMGVLNDATSALDYLLIRPDVKNTKIVIYGQSLGSHLAATVARDNQARVDALVMEGGFSSHKDVAAHMFKPITPLAWVLVKEKYKATRSIAQFHKPLLLIHSTEDEVIPYWMGERIYRHANQPKSFYTIRHPHINGPLFYADSIAYKIRDMVGT